MATTDLDLPPHRGGPFPSAGAELVERSKHQIERDPYTDPVGGKGEGTTRKDELGGNINWVPSGGEEGEGLRNQSLEHRASQIMNEMVAPNRTTSHPTPLSPHPIPLSSIPRVAQRLKIG